MLYDLQNENADLQRDLKLVSMGIDEIVSAPSLKCKLTGFCASANKALNLCRRTPEERREAQESTRDGDAAN